MQYVPYIFLAAILAAAAVTDLKSQRIPNLITLPAILAGLAWHGLNQGADGLLFALAGLGVGFVAMIIPHLFGVMGAGDVKLMAAVGALLGPRGAFTAFVATSLLGGAYALIVMARRGYARRVLANIKASCLGLLAVKSFHYRPERGLPRLCYGLAIALGTLAAMGLDLYRNGLGM